MAESNVTGRLVLANGCAGTPTLTFQGSTGENDGLFYKSAGVMGLSIGGVEIGRFASTGMTLTSQLIGKGTTTNDDAAAGYIGEYLQASRLKSAATAATSTVSLNVLATALSLTAGDWDVSGCLAFLPAASTSITLLKAGISKTSATLPATDTIGVPTAGEVSGQITTAANVATGDLTLTLPTCRISLASTTSIYLVANATFSASTLTVYGSLNARRVR